MTKTQVSPKTTTRRITSLRAFAGWVNLEPFLKGFIAPKPGRPFPHPIPEGMEGIARMMQLARNHEQEALIGLCGYVGLRITEARGICVAHFDIQDQILTVRGKGDKTRYVPLSKKAFNSVLPAYILALDAPEPHRLINYTDRSARHVITTLGKRAGLRRTISSHDLRHTFGTAALDAGANLRVVQELLGHASSQTTEGYTAVRAESMREAVNF